MGCKKKGPDDTPKPTVYVKYHQKEFQLIRNGKPFHIKGGAAHPDYLRELKEAGANTVRVYDTINLQQTLDLAQELGLAVAVDIPLPTHSVDSEYYRDGQLFNHMKWKIENIVKKYKDHPALLYWNLGNEIHYPLRRRYFFSNYKKLVNTIKEIDPNHPVSTSVVGGNRQRLTSIAITNPNLDFNSINIFGEISKLQKRPEFNKLIWKTPYVISEWGINGPWEAKVTKWKAPLEETSTKKAEQIRERYYNHIEPLVNSNSFGSLIFYWGKKNEVTPTWFSLFGNEKLKTQGVFEMEKIWKNHNRNYSGPKLEYILLNGRGAPGSIILSSSTLAEVEVVNPESQNGTIKYSAEVRNESWNEWDISNIIEVSINIQGDKIIFTTPEKEGPYRIFIYLTDGSEYYATANIPFYVLNPKDGE